MDFWQCLCGASWPAGMESRLCPACEGLRRLTETAHEWRVQRDELLAALATYGKHKPGCASGWRAETGSSRIGPCDCGLAAAFAKVEGK